MAVNTSLGKHPCFDDQARHRYARVHLPVAAKCNIQCNYCNRKHDCVAESRPGVTSAVLSPAQAAEYLDQVLALRPETTVAGIAGPGDPFASPEETMATLRMVRARQPEMLLCVATNGLGLPPYIDELAELATSHVTLTVNAVDPKVGAGVYAWVRDGKTILRGEAAAALLWERQAAGIRALRAHGVTVKINTILIPGINDDHVFEVARTVSELGADLLNLVPLYPVEGTRFGDLPEPAANDVARLRAEASRFLPQMRHCTRCRADAAGLLGEAATEDMRALLARCAAGPLDPAEDRPYVAVATREGMLINQHLGEAPDVSIYENTPSGPRMVEARVAPPKGGGDERWSALAELLRDCRALMVCRAGDRPTEVLTAANIRVIEAEGLIAEGVAAVYEGRRVPGPVGPRLACAAGGCRGSGTGCG
jgi:nitrogen fixation protein NifB